MRDETPVKAAYLIRVLRLLFSFGEMQGFIPKNSNPATKMRISVKSKKKILWQPEDIETFVKTADAMGYFSVGTAVLLNEWIGQRPGDLLRLPMNKYRDGMFNIIQSKTGAEVNIPAGIIGKLDARIAEQIKRNKKHKVPSTCLIQQENGKPFRDDGFSKLFGKIRKKAIEQMDPERAAHFKQLVFQATRHTAVTRLAEAGCEIAEIASITGHTLQSCSKIIDTYLIRINRMAKNAFEKRKKMEEQ